MPDKRILIAGYEIGGQMQLIAEGLRKREYIAHAVAFNADFRQYTTDLSVITRRIPLGRFFFFLKAIFRYEVFYFFWGVSLFDFWRFHGIDLPILKLLGKKVIIHFRGTDIFNIAYYDYLSRPHDLSYSPPPAKTRPDQVRRLKRWRRYADEICVSTPDLLELVPEAHLVPQVLDVKQITPCFPSAVQLVRIGHAPTRRNTKGTSFLLAAVNSLQARGVAVTLDLIEGELPEHVISRFSQCDIVVDQVLLGWYGKVAVEAMALGKPVICNIAEEWRKHRPDLPIVHADPGILEEVLEQLVGDAFRRRELGAAGRQYALRNHDLEVVLDQLLEIFAITEKTSAQEKN